MIDKIHSYNFISSGGRGEITCNLIRESRILVKKKKTYNTLILNLFSCLFFFFKRI